MALYQQASDESLLETLNLYIEQWDKEITSDTFIKDVSDMIGTDFDDIGNNMMCLGSELQQRNMMNTVDCIYTLNQYNNLL